MRDDDDGRGTQNYCYPLDAEDARLTDVVCDDMVALTLQYSTQWDSFAHVGSRFDADGEGRPDMVFYNGYRAGEHIRPGVPAEGGLSPYADPVANALGIHHLAEHGAQGRGVMIDLHRHYGRKRHAVGYDDLMRILETDRVAVEKGDMVCFYTGFADVILEMNRQPDAAIVHDTCTGLDGHDDKLLQWVSDTGLACLIADNYAVELIRVKLGQSMRGPRLPLHEHCLFKNGIHLGEMWYLAELAHWLRAHRRSRFLLTAPPLRLPGAVGSPATPIATV
jgi:kynurenine formamidase